MKQFLKMTSCAFITLHFYLTVYSQYSLSTLTLKAISQMYANAYNA